MINLFCNWESPCVSVIDIMNVSLALGRSGTSQFLEQNSCVFLSLSIARCRYDIILPLPSFMLTSASVLITTPGDKWLANDRECAMNISKTSPLGLPCCS